MARITELLENPGAVAVGAYQGKNLIGIAIGLPHTSAVGRTLYVAELAVVPAFQRRGVGKKLIAFVDAKAFEIGFRSVWLISQGDGTLVKFYLSNGFRQSERLRVYSRTCSAAAPE
ncbi:GNAT family N-acetyltransferase [Rhizobium leguminosarum]|nr:GNAT family N-acetyltransferase [Rhizobium leguminosarum]MBY5760271.1 GNAT family N-acetyltransferase [Rhizobium leguminosarum]